MEPAKTWMHVNVVLHARLVEAERKAYITGDLPLAGALSHTLEFMFDRRDLEVEHNDTLDRLKTELIKAEAEALVATAKFKDLQEQLWSLEIDRG